MEVKPSTKGLARWLVEQYKRDVVSSAFKLYFWISGDTTITTIPNGMMFVPVEIHDNPAIGFEDLRMHGLLDTIIANQDEWQIVLNKALFTAVESDFNDMPSSQVVNVAPNRNSPIHVKINVAGASRQVRVAGSEDIAAYLRARLTLQVIAKYPDFRALIDEIERDGVEISPTRIVALIRWIGDLITKENIPQTGGELIIFLAGVLDGMFRTV